LNTTHLYQPGQNCVLRGVIDGKVWLAQSVTVVKDAPHETILYLPVGAQCAFPAGYWRWRIHQDFSHGTRWEEAARGAFTLRKFEWMRNRLLIFLEPEKYYAPMLFWDDASGEFNCYYINFQLPYRRGPLGFDTLDLDLDIVVEPDGRWEWKDEDEYREGIRLGGIRPEWVQGIQAATPEALERIARRTPPLDGAWLTWRPDPTWELPRLPEGWREV
jgi:hypothetical protein